MAAESHWWFGCKPVQVPIVPVCQRLAAAVNSPVKSAPLQTFLICFTSVDEAARHERLLAFCGNSREFHKSLKRRFRCWWLLSWNEQWRKGTAKGTKGTWCSCLNLLTVEHLLCEPIVSSESSLMLMRRLLWLSDCSKTMVQKKVKLTADNESPEIILL